MSLTRGLDRVPRYTFFVLVGLLILLGSAATIVARTDAGPALKADGSAPIEYETAALLNPEDVTQNDVFQYYVPFDDRDLRNLFDASDRCQPSPSTPPTWVGDFLASNVSVTATADGTTIYYDHWEDGYDVDPLSPGPTTEVRILNAGDVWFITEDIDVSTTPWGSIFYHDGRDRLTVYGTEVSLVRSVAPGSDSDIGARLAGAWEVAPTSSWGQAYVIPAGEDWGSGSDFEFTAATITAWITGTQLFYNGAPVATLPAGGVYFVNGVGDGTGLSSGDSFTATQPIQVHSYSSICDTGGEFWSGNGYALMPVEQWRNEYWSPVPNRTSCSVASTDIFVYNNGGGDIGLSVDDGVLYTVTLPPGSSSVAALIAPATLNTARGVHLTGDGPFWGVVNVDSGRWEWEWGYSLIPADDLSRFVVLGWAPGNGAEPPTAQSPPNGNMAWVTPITDTLIFVDLNQDGSPDLIDCNGDGDALDLDVDGICDEPASDMGVGLTRGQTLRAGDPNDADMTAALIYSNDFDGRMAVAWGEDPCVAEPGRPYLDLGYTVLPIQYHTLSITKADEPDPVLAGQLLTYTLEWIVEGDEFAPGVVVTDVLPLPYVSYVACEGGLSCGELPPPGSGVVTWDLGDRLSPDLGAQRESGTLTLTVRVEGRPPGGVFTNTVFIDDQTPRPGDEDEEETTVVDADYVLSKRRITSSPVNIGEEVAYHIVITNTGTLSITRLPLQDVYDPVYLEYTDADPSPDTVMPGALGWNDLTAYLPTSGFSLPPGDSTQVLVRFVALTSTQALSPPVTVNTAVSEGAETEFGVLPRREDQAEVGIEDPTAIELLYFRTQPRLGAVLVEWATLFEIDTHGFWLYRGVSPDRASAIPLIFVAARGGVNSGSAYEHLDAGLPDGRYYYWLIEVENNGKETFYGPVSAVLGLDTPDMWPRLYLPLIQSGQPRP